MNRNRFYKFVDDTLDVMGGAWNDAKRDFVDGIDSRARMEERDDNIALAALAMIDGGLDEEKTISLLQKHWDLRRSEALLYVKRAHRMIMVSA